MYLIQYTDELAEAEVHDTRCCLFI